MQDGTPKTELPDVNVHEQALIPDPEGQLIIGSPLPQEIFEITGLDPKDGDIFVGINAEGDAVLEHDRGDGHISQQMIVIDGLRQAFALLGEEPHAPHRNEADRAENTDNKPNPIEATATPIVYEKGADMPLVDLQRELQGRIERVAIAENILRTPGLAQARRDYAADFIETNIDRFVEIADSLGSASADPRELLGLLERKLETEKGESSPTSEGDEASQLTKRSRRDEVVAFIEEGNVHSVSEEELYRFRRESAVQNFFAKDILAKLNTDTTLALDVLDGHDWRFAAALHSPAITEEERKQISGYLRGRLLSEVDAPVTTPERKTAIEQLRAEFGDVRFRYQGRDNVNEDKGGLDETASYDNVRALKEDLRSAGMSSDEIRSAISHQKNRARAREDSPSKALLQPYDLIELRRIELAKIAEQEISLLGSEITDKEMAEAAALPPLIAPDEITNIGIGGDSSSSIEDAADEDRVDTPDPVTPAVTSSLTSTTPEKTVAVSGDAPPSRVIAIPTAEEIAALGLTPSTVSGVEAKREKSAVIPTLTDEVKPGSKEFTPNQVFSHRMHELESRAEELAKKSALLPNEKEQLAAIEKEMSDLEMKYLADRKKRMPDVELDAQGGAMMHLINSIPNVQVNMEQSTTPALAAVAAGVISPEAAALLPVVTEIESPESSERAAISDAVLNKYKEAFGIEEETLEQIPGFRALTPGKQLLILRNMQNEVLQQVSGEADKTQKEEWKGKTVWGKLWNGVRTMGTYQTIRTIKIKKELLAAAQGEGKNKALRTEALLGHVENIEEYVKVMNTAPNVTVNPENGSLTIAYAISREGNESPKNQEILDEFNLIASKFAAVPREWGYEPKDEKEKGQYETYQTERNNYFKGREALIALYTSTFSEHGEADPRKEAMFAMSRIDERIELDQLFNAHPDAEKALNEIEDQNAIMSGVKEFWQDKGKYVAFGAAARMTATAITGALTGGIAAPFAYVIAGGVGAGVGNAQGRNEAKKVIRQRRIDRRLSEEDEREEITLKLEPLEARMKPLQTELLKNDLGVQRRMDIKKQLAQLQQRIDSGEQLQKTRKIKEFTDATFFTDRIERLTLKLEQVETPEERTLLESKIAKTTALMERKFKSGLINFGGSSVGENDERKGNDIANKLSFIQAMGKGAAVEIIDPLLLRIEMGRIIGDHQGKIESLRDKEVKNAGIKAAVIRGGFALGGAYLAGKIHESGIVDDFFKKIASYKTEAAAAIGIKEAFHQYAPGDVAHLRAAVLAHKDPDYPAELVEGANRAQANGLAEYMASNDPDVRHRIAETMGLTEAEIDARIHHFLEIAEHSHLPEEAAAAPHAAASAASAPSAPASAVSAPEAAGSVVEAEVVSLSEANGLAHDYLTADMISHNTASSELLSQEWRFMSDKNAESILSATKEQAVQSPGGADMWPSILHMQAYAKANGFTQAEGITPKSGETLEQFFLRAHAEHIMKHGVVPRVSDATVPQELGNRLVGPVPQNLSEYVTPNKPPIKVDPPLKPFSEQQVNVPSWQDNKPQLIGGSGAVPHQHSPDGGVPQRGAIGWPESKPQLDTAPHAVAPLPPPPPRPEFIREASPAFPRGLPPPPPPADFMRAPTGALPNNAPALPSPPPRPEFMTAAPNQDAGFIKASFAEDVVPTGVRMTPPTLNILRAPYPGMEQNIDRALAPMLVQARTAFGPAVDRPAVEVMSELKVSGNSLYRPFGQFLERGYVPHEGESAIAFYERCAREEFLKVKMPSTHETVVTTEAIPKVTPEARFTHNVDRLWEKLLWKNSQHEYLTNRNNTAEDLLDGKIPVSPKDVNGNSLKYWQESIRALRVKSGVVPEHGEQVEAYGKRAVAEMLRKNPLLKRDDILADRGMTESAPRVQAAPFSEVSREVTHEGIAIPKVDPEAAKHTAMIADKWAQTAKEGLNKNSFWETARNQSALMFDKVPKAQGGAQGSVQEAYAQMQGLVKKAGEMGFAANQDETAGAFLDRVAGELHVPLTAKALSVRSEHITDALGKYMPVKTDSTRLVAAETIFANKELAGQPHSPEIDDVIMVQRVLLRVQQHTGISPKPGEDVHHYLLRAVSEQLIKTPELHASTLLAPKGAAFQPADAASSVGGKPPSLVRVPPLPVKPNLRWDQQA